MNPYKNPVTLQIFVKFMKVCMLDKEGGRQIWEVADREREAEEKD
jgi:hypothetical protein